MRLAPFECARDRPSLDHFSQENSQQVDLLIAVGSPTAPLTQHDGIRLKDEPNNFTGVYLVP